MLLPPTEVNDLQIGFPWALAVVKAQRGLGAWAALLHEQTLALGQQHRLITLERRWRVHMDHIGLAQLERQERGQIARTKFGFIGHCYSNAQLSS